MLPHSLAVAWYRESQWPRLRALAADTANLDATFAGWRSTAERMCAQMEALGYRVDRIEVDVELLWAWCCAHERPLDGAARAEYVTRLAQQMGADAGAE